MDGKNRYTHPQCIHWAQTPARFGFICLKTAAPCIRPTQGATLLLLHGRDTHRVPTNCQWAKSLLYFDVRAATRRRRARTASGAKPRRVRPNRGPELLVGLTLQPPPPPPPPEDESPVAATSSRISVPRSESFAPAAEASASV